MARQWRGVFRVSRTWGGEFAVTRTWAGVVGVFVPFVPSDYNGLLLALAYI